MIGAEEEPAPVTVMAPLPIALSPTEIPEASDHRVTAIGDNAIAAIAGDDSCGVRRAVPPVTVTKTQRGADRDRAVYQAPPFSSGPYPSRNYQRLGKARIPDEPGPLTTARPKRQRAAQSTQGR